MTTPRSPVYFACGSRTLEGHPGWVTGQIERWITGWVDPRSILMTGGAQGADILSEAVAIRRGFRTMTFEASGYFHTSTGTERAQWAGADFWGADPKVRPLMRNTFMADRLEGFVKAGAIVEAMALVDPWSTTGGTWHMIRELEKRGIHVKISKNGP